MKTAALHNLGCKVNAYETDAMREILEDAGYLIVDFNGPADVYVVNTCTVTNIADRKSRQMLHRCKRNNPDAILVAVGCYVQTSFESAVKDPDIDILLGNNEKRHIAEAIDRFLQTGEKVICHREIRDMREYEPLAVSPQTLAHTRAFVKIEDGCDRFCTYCMIPFARGPVRSADPRQVLKEAERLANAGYSEIVLSGIHIASYGREFGLGLPDLLEDLERVEKLQRIRIGSVEPGFITEETVKRLAALSKLCPHFHLSMQSGCDSVLARMGRRYDTAGYMQSVDLLRTYFDHPALTTDVIAGFPGETEEEFAATCDFVRKVGFYEMHVFPYSNRKGTKADSMPGQVPGPVKTARAEKLIAIAGEMKAEYEASWEGREAEVLLEECEEENGRLWKGHTRHYLEVYCPEDKKQACRGMCVAGRLVRDHDRLILS